MKVQENGIAIRCPGLFEGEAIILLDPTHRYISFIMLALKPDVEVLLEAYHQLCQKSFNQCIFSCCPIHLHDG